jgi:hypothetical protein
LVTELSKAEAQAANAIHKAYLPLLGWVSWMGGLSRLSIMSSLGAR